MTPDPSPNADLPRTEAVNSLGTTVERRNVAEFRKTATVRAGQAISDGVMPTLEGPHSFKAGDYIAGPGAEGEFWPVKRTIFEATYVRAEAAQPSSEAVGLREALERGIRLWWNDVMRKDYRETLAETDSRAAVLDELADILFAALAPARVTAPGVRTGIDWGRPEGDWSPAARRTGGDAVSDLDLRRADRATVRDAFAYIVESEYPANTGEALAILDAAFAATRLGSGSDVREAVDAVADALNGWDQGEEPRPDTHRHWQTIVAALAPARVTAPDPETDDAPCGCGAIGVAAHTNAEHYGMGRVTAPEETP